MNYYDVARQASERIGNHEGLLYLRDLCHNANKILDVGCGEGTRLNTMLPGNLRGWGVDPSEKAIHLAKKQYPKHYFRVGAGETLPYKDGFFDLVYSAFAIEHCTDPEEFIKEMIRVCQPGGFIVVLAPNYGAPNRRSPNSTENPFNKFFEGLLKDLFPHPSLDWVRVVPQRQYHQIDADTTFEPYLRSLIYYFHQLGVNIEKFSTLWQLETKDSKIRKLVIRYLGQLEIWPFRYWGPQLFISVKKSFVP